MGNVRKGKAIKLGDTSTLNNLNDVRDIRISKLKLVFNGLFVDENIGVIQYWLNWINGTFGAIL